MERTIKKIVLNIALKCFFKTAPNRIHPLYPAVASLVFSEGLPERSHIRYDIINNRFRHYIP